MSCKSLGIFTHGLQNRVKKNHSHAQKTRQGVALVHHAALAKELDLLRHLLEDAGCAPGLRTAHGKQTMLDLAFPEAQRSDTEGY